jgi:L-ascorbate metabolism protein UlaG (beta-lactamase superfamily)
MCALKKEESMRFWMLLGMVIVGSIAMADEARLDIRLEDGEAHIWHLGHAGWLVRTSEHCLVFDYTGSTENGALDSGTLSPELLAGQQVVLFISHAHGDHFKRQVLGLRDAVKNLVVVMGWDEPGSGEVVVPVDGEWTEVSGATVLALHHDFDGIAEGFFLVRSGGLTIYHSGDHGTWSDPPNEAFRANIDRLAAAVERIDIAFISAFGNRGSKGALNQGDVYSIEALEPQVTFPMHCVGCEVRYAAFASETSSRDLPTRVGVAEAPGDFFHYLGGELR